jgi:uncharacterized membrane protein YfcA
MSEALSPLRWAALGGAVFLAGIVDSLAGGGGLITIPAYLAAGVDPALILGTNKLASSLGTFVAAALYRRALKISWTALMPALVAAAAASWLGAVAATHADSSWLRPLLLAALPAIGWIVWSRRATGGQDRSGAFTPRARAVREAAAAAPVGLYDGFFGPGAGTFYALGLTRTAGYDLLSATARAKPLNLASNAAALGAFILAGRVDLRLGLSMAAAGVAGNVVGSRLGIHRGEKVIRPAVALVCAGLFLKLAWDASTGRP